MAGGLGRSGVSSGETLAEARHQASLSVSQVSQQTRIREAIITRIESDDYSACGGDFYSRGYIRSIAQAVGADPEPLIREYDTARLGPQAITDDITEPLTPIRRHKRLRLNWIAVLVLVWLGLAAYDLLGGSFHATSAAPSPRAQPATHVGPRRQAPPTRKPATPASVRVATLTPASAAAFGLSGVGQGDNTDLAHLAIDANRATAWHTDWYRSAHFGSLYPGTGLLLDMGRRVTITAARIGLGQVHGADLQLRIGVAPTLADLSPVSHAVNAGGVVHLRLVTPAHGRYVLIWFTSLPPDPAGTFQASVYSIRLRGRP
jgi:hypothetical protein